MSYRSIPNWVKPEPDKKPNPTVWGKCTHPYMYNGRQTQSGIPPAGHCDTCRYFKRKSEYARVAGKECILCEYWSGEEYMNFVGSGKFVTGYTPYKQSDRDKEIDRFADLDIILDD